MANFLTPLLEMTLGSNYIAKQNLPPILKLMLISFVIGWSGLSIQMQDTHRILRRQDKPWESFRRS